MSDAAWCSPSALRRAPAIARRPRDRWEEVARNLPCSARDLNAPRNPTAHAHARVVRMRPWGGPLGALLSLIRLAQCQAPATRPRGYALAHKRSLSLR